MKIKQYVCAASFVVAAATLYACNGSSSGPAPAPLVSATPSIINPVPAAGGTVTPTLLNGATASITLPAASAAFTVTEVPSTTPPAVSGAALGVPILYESITPTTSATYAAGTTVTGTYTSATTLSGTYQLELFVPGQGWEAGPAVAASGNTVTFSYTLTSQIPLLGSATYIVAIAHT